MAAVIVGRLAKIYEEHKNLLPAPLVEDGPDFQELLAETQDVCLTWAAVGIRREREARN